MIAKGIITNEELKAQSSEQRANYLAVREAVAVSPMCGRFGASYRNIRTVWNLRGDFSFEKRGAVGTELEHAEIENDISRHSGQDK